MASAVELSVLDLRHFSASALRPLLEEESREWSRRLRWDYRNSAELLLSYLDSQILPGYVAVENGHPRGYAFCVYEGPKAVIGDVFALPGDSSSTPSAQIEDLLLTHAIETLRSSPGVERIESQLLLHPFPLHIKPFEYAGFRIFNRQLLEYGMHREKAAPRKPSASDAKRFILRGWLDNDFSQTASLISAAYRDNVDAIINDQYRTVSGSQRFLHNIVRFPGCGFFDASASRIAVDEQTKEIAGLLLCSRVRSDVAHITQLCVAPKYRRQGLASALLDSAEDHLRREGFSAITLTVTRANESALELYRQRGFKLRQEFAAMVWESGYQI